MIDKQISVFINSVICLHSHMQIRQAILDYQNQLLSLYDSNESRSISELVFMHLFNYSKAMLFANDHSEINEASFLKLENCLKRLLTGEPVQYVIGEKEFYGLKFLVNNHVLIPRPETEELVEWIISDAENWPLTTGNFKLLDIGTGSGCIPISIKKKIPYSDVYALDISADALNLAKQNAQLNQVDIHFIEDDILKPVSPLKLNSSQLKETDKFKVIVSNPPYVRRSEKMLMHKNVLEFEPHLALFVNDEDALLFYKHIADFAKSQLDADGKLYFEINEAFGHEVVEMLINKGFKNIVMKKDLFGKDRMIRCNL